MKNPFRPLYATCGLSGRRRRKLNPLHAALVRLGQAIMRGSR